MGWYEDYNVRMNAGGNNTKEYITKNAKLDNIRAFKHTPTYRVVQHNNLPIDSRMIREKNTNPYTRILAEQATFLFLPDSTISISDVIVADGQNYIIYDENENDIYPIFYAIKSNNILRVKVGETKPIIGQTSIGQPIYGDATEIFFEQPCYSTYKSETSYYTDFDNQINSPMGRMLIAVPYSTNADLLEEGMEFNMLGNRYKIANIDMNYVKNSKGIIELFVEKVQQSSSS